MTKQKLEKFFSKSLKQEESIWGMKLHNNMLAHQTTPADYILSATDDFGFHFTILVECKQVTCKEDGKGRLATKRLKQMNDLLGFQCSFPNHKSYFCIAFKERFWAKSDIYMIPIIIMDLAVKKNLHEGRMSFNREQFEENFKSFKVQLVKNLIPLREYIFK